MIEKNEKYCRCEEEPNDEHACLHCCNINTEECKAKIEGKIL